MVFSCETFSTLLSKVLLASALNIVLIEYLYCFISKRISNKYSLKIVFFQFQLWYCVTLRKTSAHGAHTHKTPITNGQGRLSIHWTMQIIQDLVEIILMTRQHISYMLETNMQGKIVQIMLLSQHWNLLNLKWKNTQKNVSAFGSILE